MEEAVARALSGAGAFELTGQARGPWQPDAAHGGAPTGLLASAIEGEGRGDGLRLTAFSATFHGPVPLGPVEVETEVLKPGRRQRVVAARLRADERTLVEARGILIRRGSVDLPQGLGEVAPVLAPPESCEPVDQSLWAWRDEPAFHRTANTVLRIEGGPDRLGSTGAAWFHLDYPIVSGDETSPAVRAVAAADFGNGVAHPVAFGEYLFVNCDLNVSMFREPAGEWIGLVSRTDLSGSGAGLTTTELHDLDGRFGSASQTLYVDLASIS